MKRMNRKNGIGVLIAAVLLMAVGAFAADIDITSSDSGYGSSLKTPSYTTQKIIDLSTITVGIGDNVFTLNIPAGSLVESVVVEVETVTANVGTFDVGDSASATQYASNVDAKVLATTASAATTAKFYASAGTIEVHFDAAPGATGIIRVKALVTPLKPDRDY